MARRWLQIKVERLGARHEVRSASGAGVGGQPVGGTWAKAHAAHLAPKTKQVYASTYDRHIAPRLGDLPLRDIDSETIGAFQGELQG